MDSLKGSWIKYSPSTGDFSAGGLGLAIVILGGLLVLIYIFREAILKAILFFAFIGVVLLLIVLVILYLTQRNGGHGGYY